ASNAVVEPNASGVSGSPITFISGDVHSSNWGTGKAVLDGGLARKFGIYVGSRNYITMNGFEIKNIGAPTSFAAGIDFEGGGNAVVQNCLIHEVNWTSSFVSGYGIENNHGSNQLFEKNEVYHVPEKGIEFYGGGSQSGNN